MALSVVNADPGTISSVGDASPGIIPSVGDAAGYNYTPGGTDGVIGTFSQPTGVLGASTGGTTSGGTGGTTSGPTAAQIAAAANAAKIQAAIDNGTATILATGQGSGQTAATNFTNQGNQVFGQVAEGQNLIDQARKNIGLSQINSIKQLNDMIRQGLLGQAANLSNTNALDSSAAGAVARAYGNYGNVQTNAINNQAAEGQQNQDVQQTNLGIQKDIGVSNLKAFRDDAIQKITTDTQTALDNLKQYIAIIGGDGNSVDIAGIKGQILQNAQDKLAAVDAEIQGKLGSVHAATPDETAVAAYQGSNAGVVPSGPGLPFQLADPNTTPDQTFGGAPNALIPLALKPKVTA